MPISQRPRKRHNVRKTAHSPIHQRPHPVQAWRAFEPISALLDQLRAGEVDAVRGRPVMRDWGSNELLEVGPALEGWIGCWQRIIDGERLPIDLTALRQVQRFLANDLMLNPDLVARARTITDACYQAYANTPRERIISYSKTEQIAIALDESGMLTQEAA